MSYSKSVDHSFESKVDLAGADDFGDILDIMSTRLRWRLETTDTRIIGL